MSACDPRQQFVDRLVASLADGSFVQLILSSPAQAATGPERILARCVELKGSPHLSLTLRHATRDLVRNLPLGESASWLDGCLTGQFRSALLRTTRRDYQLSLPASGRSRLRVHPPSVKEPPARAHDQPGHDLLDASAHDWLRGLGVVDADGKVRASMADKHRQINRYLEILGHLTRDAGWSPGTEHVLADMGCGKGYLTFGAWHFFRRLRAIPARVIGVETKPDLVELGNRVAREVGEEGLEFVRGTIESVELPALDALVALHACDTATDAAIGCGIDRGARLIVVAPCCHREIRPQLQHPAPLDPLLRHGLMEQRLAEWITDGLRALFLDWAGYETKVFEFVSPEHTAKNLMISAIRRGPSFASTLARERIVALKAHFGIRRHALDGLLDREAD